MPLTFPTVIKQEFTKQSNANAFVILFEIKIESEDMIYIARNNENIIFAGNEYLGFGVELDDIKEESNGKINSFDIKIDNTIKDIQRLIEGYDNLSGSEITIKVVNSGNLSTAITDFDSKYKIKSVDYDSKFIYLNVGIEDVMRKRIPYRVYNKNNCPYLYKGVECGSISSKTTCNKTLSDCRERNSKSRFGGEINIPDNSNVYI